MTASVVVPGFCACLAVWPRRHKDRIFFALRALFAKPQLVRRPSLSHADRGVEGTGSGSRCGGFLMRYLGIAVSVVRVPMGGECMGRRHAAQGPAGGSGC